MLTQLLRPSLSSQDPATAMATESVSGTLARAVENAAREGNVAELRRLRVGEAGGEPVDATDSFGMTALHCAADNGRLEAVQYLLERGASVDVPNNSKTTALHRAAYYGHAAVARELVLHGADPPWHNESLHARISSRASHPKHGMARRALEEVVGEEAAGGSVRVGEEKICFKKISSDARGAAKTF